jgi:hypothetical protein
LFPIKLPPTEPVTLIEPVSIREPEIPADPVNGNAAAADPVATVKLNVVASPLVNVSTFPLTLPVDIKLPVDTDTAEPVFTVKLNVEPSPFVKVSVFALTDPVLIKLPVSTEACALSANDAVRANEELNAYDELVAVAAFVAFNA